MATLALAKLHSQTYAHAHHELKWLLKKGGGRIFESCDISLENTPTSHAVSLALVICACSDSSMTLLSCACLRNNSNGACLPSRFLLNITVCTAA